MNSGLIKQKPFSICYLCVIILLLLVFSAFGDSDGRHDSGIYSKESNKYQDALKKDISLEMSKSPDGSRLTVQYAIIEICDKAGVPYQWEKSQKLASPECRGFLDVIQFRDVPAEKAINSILTSLGLSYGLDENGLYLYKKVVSKASNEIIGKDKYREALKNEISLEVNKSPDGSRLTVQYAIIEICEKAGVPYQWKKSQKLASPECRGFLDVIQFRDVPAEKAIKAIVEPLELSYGLDDNGLYIYKCSKDDKDKEKSSQSKYSFRDTEQ